MRAVKKAASSHLEVSTKGKVTMTGFCPMKKIISDRIKYRCKKKKQTTYPAHHGLREWLEYRIVEKNSNKTKGHID